MARKEGDKKGVAVRLDVDFVRTSAACPTPRAQTVDDLRTDRLGSLLPSAMPCLSGVSGRKSAVYLAQRLPRLRLSAGPLEWNQQLFTLQYMNLRIKDTG